MMVTTVEAEMLHRNDHGSTVQNCNVICYKCLQVYLKKETFLRVFCAGDPQ